MVECVFIDQRLVGKYANMSYTESCLDETRGIEWLTMPRAYVCLAKGHKNI